MGAGHALLAPRRAALLGLKATAAGFDILRRPGPGVVILCYHRVGGRTACEMDLPTPVFRRQMEEVAGAGPIDLDAAVEAIGSGGAPTGVVVTFDDGSADVLDLALPVLAEHRIPALLYLATAFVEEGRRFPDGARPASWGALRDALATGLLTVGSHTHRHAPLGRLAPSLVAQEVDRSRDLIGERLGVTAIHFAYPKGVLASPPGERLVRARFRSAALAMPGVNASGADPYRLRRAPVQRSDGLRFFRRKLAGGMVLEGAVRSLVDRGRYRHALR
jgi:peptidoglycan/xylan/chitin deacetylase (PgdA/CDA1 family)